MYNTKKNVLLFIIFYLFNVLQVTHTDDENDAREIIDE